MTNANEIQYELPGVIDPKLEKWDELKTLHEND